MTSTFRVPFLTRRDLAPEVFHLLIEALGLSLSSLGQGVAEGKTKVLTVSSAPAVWSRFDHIYIYICVCVCMYECFFPCHVWLSKANSSHVSIFRCFISYHINSWCNRHLPVIFQTFSRHFLAHLASFPRFSEVHHPGPSHAGWPRQRGEHHLRGRLAVGHDQPGDVPRSSSPGENTFGKMMIYIWEIIIWCIYIYICTYSYIYMCVCVCMYSYIYICICMYVYIYI